MSGGHVESAVGLFRFDGEQGCAYPGVGGEGSGVFVGRRGEAGGWRVVEAEGHASERDLARHPRADRDFVFEEVVLVLR